ISGNALSYRRIDRVFRDVAPGSEIVVVALLLIKSPELFSHFIGGLPCADYHFANAAHCLTIRRHDGDGTPVMPNVLCRYCFLADATLGEGNVLRNTSVEVMGDHDHVEGFFGRIHRVGPRRSGRRGQDICLTAHFDDVRGMPATCPFSVKGMNGSTLEG